LNSEHGGRGCRTDAKMVATADIISEAFAAPAGSIQPVQFPVVCELDFEERATKGKVQLVVVAIRPQVKQLKAA
jgi:hypothetical protein